MHGENMKLHVYQFSTITTLHLVLQTIKNTAYYNKKRLSTFLYDEHLGHTNCRQWRRLFATALRGPSSLLSNTYRDSLPGIKASETSRSPLDTSKN